MAPVYSLLPAPAVVATRLQCGSGAVLLCKYYTFMILQKSSGLIECKIPLVLDGDGVVLYTQTGQRLGPVRGGRC